MPHLGPKVDSTQWSCTVTQVGGKPAADFTVATNGGTPAPVKLKGACYSPCPINGSNKFAPAIGDWYWDSFSSSGHRIQNWDGLWKRDLPNIRGLGMNTIRVYCMMSRQLNPDGTFPDLNDPSVPVFTHKEFLDACWNGGVDPIYVLVGLPMPDTMFWLNKYNAAAPIEIAFWTATVKETVAQVSSHPAVMGFTVQNELDGANVTWPDTNNSNLPSVNFWWGQVETLAGWAKQSMGANKKLVGMAVHDAPIIPGKAAKWMAQCPSVDYWGVNSYQTYTFQSVFGQSADGPGYAGLTGAALKAVIITEWGMPATGHVTPNPWSIYEDATTRGNTAQFISRVVPTTWTQSLCLGLYYFEYCDERWNEPLSGDNIYDWCGGTPADGFPNKYWDQEGFGLFSTARGSGLPNNAPIWGNNAPSLPFDIPTPREETIKALISSWPKPVATEKPKQNGSKCDHKKPR
jgi:hypothetical protein